MATNLRIEGVRDGQMVALPPGLDAIVISTEKGKVFIELTGQVDNMVLVRAVGHDGDPGVTRLIASPMQSGRLALGVIATAE